MCLIKGHVRSMSVFRTRRYVCLIKGHVGSIVCLIKGHVGVFRYSDVFN